MKPYYLTNSIAVSRAFALKLADLCYNSSSNRTDDCGALWAAPISETSWDAPVGLIAIYASTNGDPILLGQVEDGEITWTESTDTSEGMSGPMIEVLGRAAWLDNVDDYAASLIESIRNAIPTPAE